MADDFDNNMYELCCKSLKVPSLTASGAEKPFFGAMCGLIAFRGMTDTARLSWDTSCQAAATRPGSLGLPTRTSIAWATLWQTRQDAFEFYRDTPSVTQQDVGAFPWSLTPQEFADGQAKLAKGEAPHTTTVSNIDWMAAFAMWAKYSGPIVVFLKLGAKSMVAAAEVVTKVNPYVSAAQTLLTPLAGYIGQKALEVDMAETRKQYEIDAKRRQSMGVTLVASQP